MTIHSGSAGKVLLLEEDNEKAKNYIDTMLNFQKTKVDVVSAPEDAAKKLTSQHTYNTIIIGGQIFTIPQGISIINGMLNA